MVSVCVSIFVLPRGCSRLRDTCECIISTQAQGVSVTDVLGICNFTMTMPDDSVHELIPHGSMRTLTWDDVGDFADLCVTARVHDSWQQMEAVRRGFSAFFRDGTLERLSPQSLEVALCGEPGFDVSELRSRSFVERELGQVADFLWDTLERFDYREKELFLRFVTGCSRLPRSDSLSGYVSCCCQPHSASL